MTRISERWRSSPYNYDTLTIAIPATDEYIQCYRALRLRALHTDASKFSSTYAKEAEFSTAEWRERLDDPLKCNIIARAKDTTDEDGWVGMVSVVAPGVFGEYGGPGDADSTFLVLGMWIDPRYRGRGVGKRLLQEGLAWVRSSAHVLKDPAKSIQVALKTDYDNDAAVRLYKSLGFVEWADSPSWTLWMSLVFPLQN